MGPGVQIDVHGEIVPVELQSHIWLDWSVQPGLGSVSLKEVLPTVITPLNTGVLHSAIQLLSKIMKHNFIPSVVIMAGKVVVFFSSLLLLYLWFCSWQVLSYPCITVLLLDVRQLLPTGHLKLESQLQ